MTATVLLVHGAWHGAWCWERVTPLLDAKRIPWRAVGLPTCDEKRSTPATLHDDAATVRAALDAIDGPVVVCGHSYGGFVITEGAAGHPAVRRLVYLAAYMPDERETLISLTASEPSATILGALKPRPDGRTFVDPDQLTDIFFNDCEPAAAAWAVANVSAMFTPANDLPTAFAWRDTPSVYIVTSRDNAVPPALQRRMSAHASRVLEWDTSHSPFISQPHLVADLLASLAGTEK